MKNQSLCAKKTTFQKYSASKFLIYQGVFLLVSLNFQYLKIDFQENHTRFPVFIGGVDEMTNFLKTIGQLVF